MTYKKFVESESDYLSLIIHGWKPEQARAALPNALKTELVMTGFVSDWEHFFKLRCATNNHPQARELTIPLKKSSLREVILLNKIIRRDKLSAYSSLIFSHIYCRI